MSTVRVLLVLCALIAMSCGSSHSPAPDSGADLLDASEDGGDAAVNDPCSVCVSEAECSASEDGARCACPEGFVGDGTRDGSGCTENHEAPSIDSADAATFQVGSAGSFTIHTRGTPTPTLISVSGTLPRGVTFTNHEDGTAELSGAPGLGQGGSYALTITADNGVAPAATLSFALTVNETPAITSHDVTTFHVGASAGFNIQGMGYPAPVVRLSGSLPDGVTFIDQGNGRASLAGTPLSNTGGAYALVLAADNGIGAAAQQQFTLNVFEPPRFLSTDNAMFSAGASNSFEIETAGYPRAALQVTGNLPTGVQFTDHGDGTATLAGTLGANTGGVYALTLQATNDVEPDASQTFALSVSQAPSFSNSSHAVFTVGNSSSFEIVAPGYPAVSIGLTGTLPAGLQFVDHGDGTAVISGTPAASSGGSYALELSGTNGTGSAASQTLTLAVHEALAFTSAPTTTFTAGAAGSFSIVTSGYPHASSISVSGTLPTGVTLSDTGNGTASLSGTPASGSGGTYTVQLTADNGGGSASALQSFELVVNEAPGFSSAASATFAAGASSTFTLQASGYPATTTFALASGTLPSGVTLTSGGVLSGTPAAGSGGVYTLTFSASNGVNPAASQSFTLTVEQAPAFTSAASATMTAGESSSFTLSASGYPAPSFAIRSGTLPDGVALTGGVLSGTAADPGTYNLELTASNGVEPEAVQSFVLTVAAAVVSVTGVSPNPLIPGQSATITGKLFAPTGNTVTINGVTAPVTSVVDATQLVIRVPCMPTASVPVVVSNSTGTSPAFNAPLQASAVTLAVGETHAPANATDSECTELTEAGAAARYLISVFSVSTSPSSNAPFVLSGSVPTVTAGADTLQAPETLPAPQAALDTHDTSALGVLSNPSANHVDPSSELALLALGQAPPDAEVELAESADAQQRHTALLETNARAFDVLAPELSRDPRMQSRPSDAVAFDVVAPPTSRSFRLPNASSGAMCTTFTALTATRVYYSGKLAIYEDDATPDAFKAASNTTLRDIYNRIGDEFNADMEPILRTHFGDPLRRDAVTDNNGVLIMLTTPKINTMFSGIAGFSTTCDQFPNDEGAGNTNTSSNFGEIVYAYQPNVAGTGYSANTADNWYRTIRSTLIHEVKHVASYAARVANNATSNEEIWLEEGTARLAEELWARQAVDALPWKANNPYGNVANPVSLYCDSRPDGFPECSSNPRRPASIMQRHFTSLYTNLFGTNARLLSPFGMTASDNASYYYAVSWSLVRYLIDRYATGESAFLTQLSNSTSAGVANLLAAAGGVDLTEALGGWSLSLFADDYPGFSNAPSSSQQPTWNLRSIYAGLNTDFPSTYTLVYPATGTSLSFGAFRAAAITTLRGGGSLYYNLSGTQTSAQAIWLRTQGDTAPNANLRIRIMRVE